MSNIKNEAIDNNISSNKSEISNNNNVNSQITHKSKEIKNVKKVYRYNLLLIKKSLSFFILSPK